MAKATKKPNKKVELPDLTDDIAHQCVRIQFGEFESLTLDEYSEEVDQELTKDDDPDEEGVMFIDFSEADNKGEPTERSYSFISSDKFADNSMPLNNMSIGIALEVAMRFGVAIAMPAWISNVHGASYVRWNESQKEFIINTRGEDLLTTAWVPGKAEINCAKWTVLEPL